MSYDTERVLKDKDQYYYYCIYKRSFSDSCLNILMIMSCLFELNYEELVKARHSNTRKVFLSMYRVLAYMFIHSSIMTLEQDSSFDLSRFPHSLKRNIKKISFIDGAVLFKFSDQYLPDF